MGVEVEHESADLPSIEEMAKQELFKAAVRAMNNWKENTRQGEGAEGNRDPWVNTGEGVNSITISPQSEGSKSYEVGSDKVQMAVAEFGAVPHWPPFEPIADWVNEQSGMPKKGNDNFYPVVKGVQRSIAERGIKGFAPGRKSAETVRKNLEDNIEESISRKIEDRSI